MKRIKLISLNLLIKLIIIIFILFGVILLLIPKFLTIQYSYYFLLLYIPISIICYYIILLMDKIIMSIYDIMDNLENKKIIKYEII